MRVMGLSGGIACGKSTVTELLRREGVVVLDCDEIAKSVVRKGRWGWKRIVKAFGPSYLKEDGELDRVKLSALVFSDTAARRHLNAATHLPVMVELLRQLAWSWLTLKWVVVIDMPLLYETGAYRFTHPNVLVACSPEVQLSRLMTRDGSTREEAEARIVAQTPLARKAAMADIVIDNDGALQELAPKVHAVMGRLRRHAALWGLLTSPLALVAVVGSVVALLR